MSDAFSNSPDPDHRSENPVQTILVFAADAFRVTTGANLGDPITDAEDLVFDDIYTLSPNAQRQRLTFHTTSTGHHIASGTEIGHQGATLHLDCVATFMAPTGQMLEALILAEVQNHELVAVYLMPLAELPPRHDYTLVGIDRDAAQARFADLACVSFSHGTHITLATGAQCKVEDLTIGDRVLTRNNGPQPIRWIGRQTTRASGAFAPICIRAGVLHNSSDLIVSPSHRLFIYQRRDELDIGRAEILVKAADLVNGVDVIRTDGGFVDYFQLLFDSHEIIYAEGIAAESLLIDQRSQIALPKAVREHLRDHSRRPYLSYEIGAETLDAAAAERLRKASRG